MKKIVSAGSGPDRVDLTRFFSRGSVDSEIPGRVASRGSGCENRVRGFMVFKISGTEFSVPVTKHGGNFWKLGSDPGADPGPSRSGSGAGQNAGGARA